MSFTDGKPRYATKRELGANWSGGKPGEFFRCSLCGYKFQLDDYWRWQYTNDVSGAGGNPMVCEKCDGTKEEIVAKYKRVVAAYNDPTSVTAAITAAEEAERERIAKALDEYGDRATARAIRERREGKK